MTRKNLFFLVIAFIVGVSVWIYHVNRGMKETQAVLLENAERTRPIAPRIPVVVSNAETRSGKTPVAPSPEKERLATELLDLQDQLATARQQLEEQRQVLESYRSQQLVHTEQQRTPANFSMQMQSSGMEIEGFSEDLRNFDREETEINRRADDLLRVQSSEAQASRDRVDENIRNQESALKLIEEDINYWKNTIVYGPEREARLSSLQSLLTLQKDQLELLRQEKTLISSQLLANNRAIIQEKEQRLEQVRSQRTALQDDINSIRQSMLQLEREQFQSRASRESILNQINRAQRGFESANGRVRTIEASIKEKADELTNIQ